MTTGVVPNVLPIAAAVSTNSGSALALSAGSILNTKVVAYDVTTTGTLSFNLNTGSYSAAFQLPAGITLDTSALKTLASGQFAVPSINPIQAVSAFEGLKTSVTTNYDQVRVGLYQQYGGGNVFFTSQRFTDWASPENAAATAATAVATGGSTSGQIIQQAKDVILGELNGLYTWLQAKAPGEIQATLAAALQAMVTGQDVSTPYVAVKVVHVDETYSIGLGGPGSVLASGLGVGTPSGSITSTHLGFAVIWKGPGDSLGTLTSELNKFNGASLSGQSGFATALSGLLNVSALKGLGPIVQAVLTGNPSAAVDSFVEGKLATVFGLTPTQLNQLYQPGNPIVDLRSTNLATRLSSFLGNFAVGNAGSVTLTKLQFNLNTDEILAQVNVEARQNWGSVSDILNAVGKAVGEWADKAGDDLKQSVNSAGSFVRDTAYGTGSEVKESWDTAGGYVKETWDGAGGYVHDAFQNGAETVRDTYKNGVETLRDTFRGGSEVLRESWNTAGGYVKETWDGAGGYVHDAFQNGAETVRDTYNNGVETLRDTFRGGSEVLRESWNTAGGYVKETWTSSGDYIKETWDKAGNYASSAWDKFGHSIGGAVNDAGNFVKGILGL